MLSPSEAKARLHAGGEIAFLDVREAGQFGEGHPLFAVPCPYSRLELVVSALVPRGDAPVLLIDAGDRVAEKAARRLGGLCYKDVSIVAGGAPDWEAAGLTLFKGVNVPSKTLGELAEAIWHPAILDAGTLRSWRREGRDFCFFDARPAAEYDRMHVPGAACLPNGELAHRFRAAVLDDATPVLISCAGRTRGIVGAIGLKLAGIPNPVFALENGTQGWALAGEELRRGGRAEPYPMLSEAEMAASRRRATAICGRWHIPQIDMETLHGLRAERGRTTYLFDVRSAEEFAAGHLPGGEHAPSGQIVQATDQWIGIRRARVVLADDTGLRAALAAFWLRQLGWETCVLQMGSGEQLERGSGRPDDQVTSHRPFPHRFSPEEQRVSRLSAASAAEALQAGTHVLLDLRSSQAYRAGHPAGATWATRSRLSALALRGKVGILLLADEPAVAELAAEDLRGMGCRHISLIEGGLPAWKSAGLSVETTPESPSPAEAIDFLHFVHDRHDGNLEASRRYLAWEQGLAAQLDMQERAEFRLERPSP